MVSKPRILPQAHITGYLSRDEGRVHTELLDEALPSSFTPEGSQRTYRFQNVQMRRFPGVVSTRIQDVASEVYFGQVWSLPHHKVIVGTRDQRAEPVFRALEQEGYTHLDIDVDETWQWRVKDSEVLFREMRRGSLPSVDSRAYDIVDAVTSHLPEGAEIEFVTYKPRWEGKQQVPIDSGAWIKVFGKGNFALLRDTVRVPARWAKAKLAEVSDSLPLAHAVGIGSRVHIGGATFHIPMADYCMHTHGEPELSTPGIVVASGVSYHFYGSNLLSEEQWINHVTHMSENAWREGCDKSWVDFQLDQGFSMLRITPAMGKFSQPVIVNQKDFSPTGSDETSEKKVVEPLAA